MIVSRRKSQSGHGALFMVGGFALSSLGDETPKTAGVSAKAQLTPEKTTIAMTKRVGSHERNPLEVENRMTGLVG